MLWDGQSQNIYSKWKKPKWVHTVHVKKEVVGKVQVREITRDEKNFWVNGQVYYLDYYDDFMGIVHIQIYQTSLI